MTGYRPRGAYPTEARLQELDQLEGDWRNWLQEAAKNRPPQEVKRSPFGKSRRTKSPVIEASYQGLDGEWLEWLEVARLFERKVPAQDREDLRHTIILELALARAKSQEPIPLYRAYRIASYMVADYWREKQKLNTGLDCRHCSKAQRAKCKKDWLYSECPKLIKLEYLESEHVDAEGNRVTIQDTLADDKAIDLDAWLDINTFLLGCPTRLIEIAHKKRTGDQLSWSDHKYWERTITKERARYQKTLF